MTPQIVIVAGNDQSWTTVGVMPVTTAPCYHVPGAGGGAAPSVILTTGNH